MCSRSAHHTRVCESISARATHLERLPHRCPFPELGTFNQTFSVSLCYTLIWLGEPIGKISDLTRYRVSRFPSNLSLNLLTYCQLMTRSIKFRRSRLAKPDYWTKHTETLNCQPTNCLLVTWFVAANDWAWRHCFRGDGSNQNSIWTVGVDKPVFRLKSRALPPQPDVLAALWRP